MLKPLGGDWARHPGTSCRWIEDGRSVSVRCSSFRPGRLLSLRPSKLAHRKSTPLGRNTTESGPCRDPFGHHWEIASQLSA